MNIQEICDKYINRFILRGRKFVKYTCFRYGYFNELITGQKSNNYIDDFQYFVFTKSIKSLISIRELLKLGHVEDVFIILRSSFEGYLSSRYISETKDVSLLDDFLFIPLKIASREIIYDGKMARMRGGQEEIDYNQRQPKDLRLGKDKDYFFDFYDILCNYAHCNYSIIYDFADNSGVYTYDNSDNMYLAKIFVLFVYTKIFESIVTVEGEDFINRREEQECYKLVRESTKFVFDRLNELSNYKCDAAGKDLNKHMKKMFKNMKKSLKEELGSIKKDFL